MNRSYKKTVCFGENKTLLDNKTENTHFKTCKSNNLHISDALITTLNIRADFPQKAFLIPEQKGKWRLLFFVITC